MKLPILVMATSVGLFVGQAYATDTNQQMVNKPSVAPANQTQPVVNPANPSATPAPSTTGATARPNQPKAAAQMPAMPQSPAASQQTPATQQVVTATTTQTTVAPVAIQ